MKRFFVLSTLFFVAAMAHALPFVTTTNPSSNDTHWYQLKTLGKYVYASPDGIIDLADNAATTDAYLWCFVTTSSNKVIIYNRARKSYLCMGWSFTQLDNDNDLNYVEAGSGSSFYIYWKDRTSTQYLNYDDEQGFYTSAWKDNTYTVNEVEVPKVTPKPVIDVKIIDDNCVITVTGEGQLVLFIDDDEVENPHTIPLTFEDQYISIYAIAKEEGKEWGRSAMSYTIPAKSNRKRGEELERVNFYTTGYSITNELDNFGDEGFVRLFDNDRNTRWRVVQGAGSWRSIMIAFRCDEPFFPNSYTFTTASDTQTHPNRNPKAWKLSGKTEESDGWVLLSDITDGAAAGLGTANTTDYEFPITSTKPYKYFRLDILDVCGTEGNKNVLQLAELQMKGNALVPIPYGDVNADGNVNVTDVNLLVSAALAGTCPSGYDLNFDGSINVTDINLCVSAVLSH